jgi:bifunctional DNA-binding transcriptional regulator/antitoxin component of YhaV-PrlF toxin-antitoxin module
MAVVIPVSKRGTVTLPPDIRRRMGLDRLTNPMLLAEEKDGKLVLQAAAALPVRDISETTLKKWIREDEAAMVVFEKTRKK